MSSKIIVVGAGMAGLLAGAILRNRCHGIWEATNSLPNNHSAVLRFRSTSVADALNIPFKKVQVMKATAPWINPIADALSYSTKTNGTATIRSSHTADGTLVDRYIAPQDLIQRMYEISEDHTYFGCQFLPDSPAQGFKFISTIPMPVLMGILDWPKRQELKFKSVRGINIVADLVGVDAYCSLYIPDPSFAGSRISITGSQMIIECYPDNLPSREPNNLSTGEEEREIVNRALKLVGLRPFNLGASGWKVKHQQYGKILPIDDQLRKEFIMWASDVHGVYSLGRFATWRPGLLLDDVVSDVRTITRLIDGGSSYDHRK